MSIEEEKKLNEDQVPPVKQSKAGYIMLGALIMLVILGYVIYDQWIQPMMLAKAKQHQGMQSAITSLQQNTETQQKTLQGLTDDVSQLKQTVADQANTNREKWLAEEVRYKVKLADMNLQFRQNTKEAITLLQLADQDIRDAKDPGFADVRKALSADMVDLQSVPDVDKTGIYLRLLALNGKVDQLPLMNKPNVGEVQAPAATTTEDNVSWWRKGLDKSFATLRSLVVVRYHQSGNIPLIAPDLQVYLYQNWHAVLMHAMSALMQGENDIYHASLQQAASWIKVYSMPDEPVAKAFLDELTQLQAINIHPDVPKLTRSLQAVEALTVS